MIWFSVWFYYISKHRIFLFPFYFFNFACHLERSRRAGHNWGRAAREVEGATYIHREDRNGSHWATFFFSLFLFLFITSIFSLDEMGAYSRFDPILFSLFISPGITQLLRSISLSISLSKILDLCRLPKLSLGRPPPVEWPPATTSPSDQAVPNTCHKRSNVMGF